MERLQLDRRNFGLIDLDKIIVILSVLGPVNVRGWKYESRAVGMRGVGSKDCAQEVLLRKWRSQAVKDPVSTLTEAVDSGSMCDRENDGKATIGICGFLLCIHQCLDAQAVSAVP